MLVVVGAATVPGLFGADTDKASSLRPEKIALAAPAPQTVKVAAQSPQLPPQLNQKTEGIDPELLVRFDRFRTFVFQNYGAVIEINSGYRSTAKQAYLYRTLPRGMASAPGTSLHEEGEAIDYTNPSPTFNQHLSKFGLKAPYPGVEDWHVERA